jgi:hypothetical protein
MQSDPESLFEMLEPPPGGIERMRARLAARKSARGGFAVVGAGVVALAVLVALGALVFDDRLSRDAGDNAILASPELDRLLGRESRPVPLTVERDGQAVQIEQLPSSDPRVRIYRAL